MQVLLLGGHGKVALHLTPLLLNRAWNVTSVVRNPDHEKDILALGNGRKGNLNVLISSLAEIKSAADAQKILNKVMPDYVVWSAGTLPLILPASAVNRTAIRSKIENIQQSYIDDAFNWEEDVG
jgi:dTDP-4-dehydrorhamnose reductase